jgi:hypothetical protein
MNNYYVYLHKTKDGIPFYVGKGKGKRAYSTNRNADWLRFVDSIGEYDVEIPYNNLSEDKALEIEKNLIAKIGLDNLTNILAEGYITTKPLTEFDIQFNFAKALIKLFYDFNKIYKSNPKLAIELYEMVEDYNILCEYSDSLKRELCKLR